MPQSLVHEFLSQKAAGNPLRQSLKEAIFQAQPPDIEAGQAEDGPKFKLWKVRLRPKNDDEPVYVHLSKILSSPSLPINAISTSTD
jgi:potassium channel subfamily K